jgi:hypothetical protein
MTDARISADAAQVAMVLPTTSVDARVSATGVQAAMRLSGIEGRCAALCVQVAVQQKRTYVTLFDGTPVRVWSGGVPIIVRTM